MGTDIHTYVVSEGKTLASNLFDGRNSEWFTKILQEEDEYALLPWQHQLDERIPQEFISLPREDPAYFFGFKFVKISDLFTWFNTYHPDLDAGWVRKKTFWEYKVKHVPISEDDVFDYLNDGATAEDWVFLEFPAFNDCMDCIIKQIADISNLDKENSYLLIYFDS